MNFIGRIAIAIDTVVFDHIFEAAQHGYRDCIFTFPTGTRPEVIRQVQEDIEGAGYYTAIIDFSYKMRIFWGED